MSSQSRITISQCPFCCLSPYFALRYFVILLFLHFIQFTKICDDAQSGKSESLRNGLDVNHSNDSKMIKDPNLPAPAHDSQLSLRHLLLLPIHRIGKYEKKLRQIISVTEEIHPDRITLSNSLRDVSGVNVVIHDKMREFTEREVVRKIANALKGNSTFTLSPSTALNVPHSVPYRKFIKNGYLIKMGKSKPQRYLFFLFNDVLFYCKTMGPSPTTSTSPGPIGTVGTVGVDGTEKQQYERPKVVDNAPSVPTQDIIDNAPSVPTNELRSTSKEPEQQALSAISDVENAQNTVNGQDTVRGLKLTSPASHGTNALNTNNGSNGGTNEGSGIGAVSTVAHDYSDTSDLHQITSLFGPSRAAKTRRSRTKLFSDSSSQSEEEEMNMAAFGMNMDINNEIDVFGNNAIPPLKVHNFMPIDGAFEVRDFRLFPQRYDGKAFEIRSSVKSFLVYAESERAKKEWMSLLEHCMNQVALSMTNHTSSQLVEPYIHHPGNTMSSSSGNVPSMTSGGAVNSASHSSVSSVSSASGLSKRKRMAATLYLPNDFTEMCMRCNRQFGYSRRKNWCHHCGYLVWYVVGGDVLCSI